MKTFIAISGSIRKDSYNTNLLRAAQEVAGEGVHISIYDISKLPFYNQDEEALFPQEAIYLKEALEAADGVIFATPEYNRSIPGYLKNAIDWASRPYGKNSFKGKPVLVLGVSVAPTSAALAQYHLKQIMNYLDARVLGQPEFYMGSAIDKFDSEGRLIDQESRDHLKKAIETLVRT